jgi:hypothetical protein
MTGLVSAAAAAVLWCSPAHAQFDAKVTNGSTCEPMSVAASSELGTPAATTANAISRNGGRFSTQYVSGAQTRKLVFVCPLVRDNTDTFLPVNVAIRVNTYNSIPVGHFTCRLKVVNEQGTMVAQTADVYMEEGYDSTVLSAPIVAPLHQHAYVLNCVVPNLATQSAQPSGVLSYRWEEEELIP